jgi:AcrR family transcriptional regulator
LHVYLPVGIIIGRECPRDPEGFLERGSTPVHHRSERNDSEQNPRTRLLEAGVALFAKKGYADTSVREIVEGAGVTKPVLYYYFKSKEGIFRAILDRAAEQQETLLSNVLEGQGSVLDRVIHLYRHVHAGVRGNPALFKMI